MTDRHVRGSFLQLVAGEGTPHAAAGDGECAQCARAAELRTSFEREFDLSLRALAVEALPAGTVRAQWTSPGRRGVAAALVAVGVLLLVVGVTMAVPPLFLPAAADPTPEATTEGTPQPTAVASASDLAIPFQVLDVEPRPGRVSELGGLSGPTVEGPVVDVARGRLDLAAQRETFHFTVFRSVEHGVCIQVAWVAGSGGAGCGSMPGDGPMSQSFGSVSYRTDSPLAYEVTGLVDRSVEAVWVETSTGGRARAQLVPLDAAEIDAQLFFVFLPAGGDPSALVAMDAAGNVIERVDLPDAPDLPEPQISPTAAPTPAGE